MPQKVWGITKQVVLGVILTAAVGWAGSILAYSFRWGVGVDSQLAAAAGEQSVMKSSENDHWDEVNKSLTSIDHRLDRIEDRLDNLPKTP